MVASPAHGTGISTCPISGASPPPFHERVPSYHVRIIDGMVFVHPHANPPGTPVKPEPIGGIRGSEDRDEFYVGYEPSAPPRLASWTKHVVAGLCAAGLCVSLSLVLGQQRFAPAAFEFQQTKEFEGVIEDNPVPSLLIRRPGATGAGGQSQLRRHLGRFSRK
jgi:hypothetical protein